MERNITSTRAHGYTVEIVDNPKAFQSVQPDWDGLFERADRPYLSQSFEWTWCAWETIAKPRGGRLHCIVIRESRRLALIWPLTILPYHRLWRAAKSLNLFTGYNDVLVEASPQARQLANLAWQSLQKSRGMDLILAERVRADSLLHQVLQTEKAAVTHGDVAVHVGWEEFQDWDAYHRRLSWRQTLDRQFRRLQECGHVAFELVENTPRQDALIAWLLQRKLEQLARQGTAPVWGNDAQPLEAFLTQASHGVRQSGKLLVFALLLENEPLAVQIWTLDAFRMAVMQIAYDSKWSKYGPGNLLFRHCLQWAFERRLPVDFGLGDFGYKKIFGNGGVEVFTRIYAINVWGHSSLWCRALRRRLKTKRLANHNPVPPQPVSST